MRGTPFSERAQEMGLEVDARKGLYTYHDRYGHVVYRELVTITVHNDNNPHPTDGEKSNLLGIFTKSNDENDEFKFISYVSSAYKFFGNDAICNQVRQSIQDYGVPVIRENVILNSELTRLRNEIIVSNGQHVQEIGDVLPVMVVNNSYDGTRSAGISFGIALHNPMNISGDFTFAFNLGEIKQVHLATSDAQVHSAVASYAQAFSENITDLIRGSFNKQLEEKEMLSVLDVVEGISKNRRVEISKLLQELNPPQQEGHAPPLPSAWQVFLAIIRYSSFEPNLNVKKMLESAAETVLVIPIRMYDVLKKLQKEVINLGSLKFIKN